MNSENVFKRKTRVIDDDDDNMELEERNKNLKNHENEKKSTQNGHAENKKPSSNGTHSNDHMKKVSGGEGKPAFSIEDRINQLKKDKNKVQGKEDNKKDLDKQIIKKNLNNSDKKEDKNRMNNIKQLINNKRSAPIEKKNIISNNKRNYSESDESDDSEYVSGEESEDESYSGSVEENDDESSESSSEQESEEKPKKNKKIHKNEDSATKKSVKKTEAVKTPSKVKSGKVLKTKGSLVNQLLRRWWFVLPKWPPEDYDTSESLKINDLKLIEKSEWKLEPNIDDKGFKKCIELDGFKYVYIDYSGKLHDLRPKDTMPSYNNFIQKPEKELYELLIEAISNQIKELENGEKYCKEDYNLIKDLEKELEEVESNYARLK